MPSHPDHLRREIDDLKLELRLIRERLVRLASHTPVVSSQRVLFEIDEIEAYSGCGCATVTVVAGPCSGTPAKDDTLTVYDHAGCFFDVPADDLVGILGFASKLRVELTEGGYPTGQFECRWVVDSLCCGAVI